MFGRKDKTTILVVASDISMGRVVNQALRHADYMVGDVRDATNWTTTPLDARVVILIGSDPHWIEYACSTIRRMSPSPLLVVMGPDDFETRVRLFEIGVDAYLDEPFAPAELLARIASLIRMPKYI